MEAFVAGVFRAPPRGGVAGPRFTPLSGLPLFHGRRRRRLSSSVVCMAEPYLIAKLDSAKKAVKEKAWKEMSLLLLPSDPLDKSSILLEVRTGAGGDEAGIWAGDLVGR